MPGRRGPESPPYRQEDLEGRVDALRRERDEVQRALGVARARPPEQRPWSWGLFTLGLCVPLTLAILLLGIAMEGAR